MKIAKKKIIKYELFLFQNKNSHEMNKIYVDTVSAITIMNSELIFMNLNMCASCYQIPFKITLLF